MKKACMAAIRFYQREGSPLFPPRCRYTGYDDYLLINATSFSLEEVPQAVEKYGAVKGSFLAAKRILRCNPFHKGGYDPVP